MASQKLTSKTLFGATLNLLDVLHIVDVSDTAQDPAGSSFKLNLSQLKTFINDNIYNTDGTLTSNRVVAMNTFSLDFTNGNIGIGGSAVSGTRLTSRSQTSTSSNYSYRAYDSSSVELFSVRGDGYIFAGLSNGSLTIGNGSGFNSSLAQNTFVGVGVAPSITTGDENTSVGRFSMLSITTAARNSAFGRNSLLSLTTGTDNTSLGQNTLTSATTASLNVAVGQSTGSTLITGSGNVFIGAGASSPSNCFAGVAIGQNATLTASNQMVVGGGGGTGGIDDAYIGESVTKSDANLFVGKVHTYGFVTTSVADPAWRLGTSVVAAATLDTTKYLTVEVSGVSYKLALII